ncbi:hypothetical protein A2U01_0080520, partial [Trifolium medium]|nr:hypothetical protein [Trifolium medium]
FELRRAPCCFVSCFSPVSAPRAGVAAPRAELCFRAGCSSVSCAARRLVLRHAQAWFARVDFC